MQTTKWATAASGGRGVGFVRGDPLGQDDGDGDGEVDGDGNDDGPAAEPDAAPGDVPAAPLEPPGGSSPSLPVSGGGWRDDRALCLAAVAAAACALAGAAVGIRRRLRRKKALRRVRELLHAVQRDAASRQEGCSGEAGAAAAGGSGGGEGSPELEPLGAAQTLRDLLSATPSEQADTAQLVLRSGGVGVVTRRLGDTATDAGLRAALLQALVLLASSPRHESDTLAELAAAGGVPLLTGLLSARATDAEDRRAAARLLWRLSALPDCWAEMAGQVRCGPNLPPSWEPTCPMQ
eukprot:jgi/Tetstr1/457707/TSEL_044254.t1